MAARGAAGAILLDAPCSATGTLRRRPDIPWTRTAADIEALSRLQAALLANAVSQLRPGGVLVYAVCSLEAEEGPDRIAGALADDPELERLPIDAAALGPMAAALTPDGDVQTLPLPSGGAGRDGRLLHRADPALHLSGNPPGSKGLDGLSPIRFIFAGKSFK